MATQTETAPAMATESYAQVRIRMSTKDPALELPENTGPVLVSTDLKRFQLSTLVNRLLATEKPIPFEFLIHGTILRTSLDGFLTDNGISAETTLQVEYVRAQIPPQQVASFQHDDWVSSVDLLSSTSLAGQVSSTSFAERILSGSYDGLLRTWSASGDCVATSSAAHGGPIKAARFLSASRVASASIDRSIRIWDYSETSPSQGSLSCRLQLYGHSASVDSLAVHHASGKIMSASADHNVCLFDTSSQSLPEVDPSLLTSGVANKRRKLSSAAPRAGPAATLRAHTAPVSDVAFHSSDSVAGYSTSWDHTLKTWDLVTARCIDTRTTAHALLCVLPLPRLGLVAAGSSARHISLIDPREDARVVVPTVCRGHTNAVVGLAASPDGASAEASLDSQEAIGSVFASASHDGTVRVWDARMSRAPLSTRTVDEVGVGLESAGAGMVKTVESLYVLGSPAKKPGEASKVFDIKWDTTFGMVWGGEAKRVEVWRRE